MDEAQQGGRVGVGRVITAQTRKNGQKVALILSGDVALVGDLVEDRRWHQTGREASLMSDSAVKGKKKPVKSSRLMIGLDIIRFGVRSGPPETEIRHRCRRIVPGLGENGVQILIEYAVFVP